MYRENRKTILLVEDEAVIAIMEKRLLEKKGYTVHTVSTGEKAVETIIDDIPPVDLILMDIDLGSGIDGTEAAAQILDHKDIPVVFLSSHTEPEVVEKTEKITSYGYVVKNSGLIVLDASIKMALKLFDEKNEHKLKEVALQKSEQLFYELFERAPLGYQSLDSDGKFLAVNQAWLETLGYKLEEVIGKWFGDFLAPEYVQTFRERFPLFKAQGRIHSEFYMLHKNGNRVYIAFDGRIGYNLDGNFKQTHCILRDDTERKQAEDELRKKEKDLRESQRIAHVGSWRLDVATNEVVWTEELYNMYGFDPSLPPPPYTEHMKLFTPESWDKLSAALAHTMETGIPYTLELVTIKKDGSNGWMWVQGEAEVDSTGKTVEIWGAAQDITEHKRAEEALKAKNEEFEATNEELTAAMEEMEATNEELISANQSIQQADESLRKSEAIKNKMVSNISDVIVIIDGNGINKYKSPNIIKLFGWTPEELVGKNTWDIIHPDDLEAGQSFFSTILTKPDASGTTEIRYKRKDGNYVWIEISVINLLHDRDIQGILGNYHDITERKQAEDEIKKQFSEKETLLREIHHRVKNNIGSIEGFLTLQDEATVNPEAKSAIKNAIARVQSMRILYDKLLLSKDLHEISMKDYIEDLIDSLHNVFDKKDSIVIEKHISDFSILSKQAITIGIIINELLTNVYKYAFKDREKGVVSVSIEKSGNKVMLAIQDNGIGTDEGIPGNKSHGLGLTIVKMLVEQLNGTCSFVNDNGTKSVVQFEL